MVEGNATAGHERITDAVFPVALGWMVQLKELNTLKVALPGRGEVTEVQVKAFTPSELKGLQRKERVKKETYQLKLLPDSNLAVLKIGSFSYQSAGKYHRFLKKSFKRIKRSGLNNLAIDLRNNTGGNSDRMEMLFGYLTPNPPAVPANIIAKQSPTSQAHISRQYKGLKRFVIDHFYKGNEDAINYRKMAALEPGVTDTLYYTKGPKPEDKKRFQGTTYLLINGRSGSASVNFASIFKSMNLGLVLGEPCLGPKSGTWGNAANAELPNSQIKLYLSTIRYNTDNLFLVDPDPVQPDVFIEYTPEDLRYLHDPVLERVYHEINSGQ
jgi:C-terminal processing protease CtpA/Prc